MFGFDETLERVKMPVGRSDTWFYDRLLALALVIRNSCLEMKALFLPPLLDVAQGKKRNH